MNWEIFGLPKVLGPWFGLARKMEITFEDA